MHTTYRDKRSITEIQDMYVGAAGAMMDYVMEVSDQAAGSKGKNAPSPGVYLL
jgi:hypothetical protein